VILVDLEQYDYALQAYNNGLESIMKIERYEEDMLYYLLHLNLGEVLMLSGDAKNSESHYQKVIDLSEKYNHDYSFPDMLLMLVDFHKSNNDFEKACYFYDKFYNRNSNIQPATALLNEKKDKESIKKELSQLKQLRDTNQVLLRRLTQIQQASENNEMKVNIDLDQRLTKA
jgi:TolA-binding protein